MAGVPMVQPTPFSPRKPIPHCDLHDCEHCAKLCLEAHLQRAAYTWEIIAVITAILSLGSMAYYVLTGNEIALLSWVFFSALLWIF